MSNLLIVESPTKAPTVKGYLGSSYKVVASKGHIRDLPKSTLGVDIDNEFEPHYINIRGKGDLIRELKKEVKAADKVFLATDPDREGEAIAWHLVQALDIPAKKARRVTFNEITKNAVKDAMKHPRDLDMALVDAQQSRRILDRIVGYKLSPYLWRKVQSGLSAGRVQSVATRIIVDRENEIRAFEPKEYWTIDADLNNSEGSLLEVRYFGDNRDNKTELHSRSEAEAVLNAISGCDFIVDEIKEFHKAKNPTPPFTTSTMQQEASRKLNFQSQRTMKVAQELYEGIQIGNEHVGLITYMRTDSLRISEEAQSEARDYIGNKYGAAYVPEKPKVYKSKAGAQDAHEAIRPSRVTLDPKSAKAYLSNDQYRLYKLIWERFVASQMQNADLAVETVTVKAGEHFFRASGYTVAFQGFLAVYEETSDDKDSETNTEIPKLKEKEKLCVKALLPEQHFTEPPARFTEASLIKFLEENGIGRPSTYTPIISIILTRGYVARNGKSLVPTQLGEITTSVMVQSFPDIVDETFTAQLETKLDGVEDGTVSMKDLLSEFYQPFEKELEAAEKADGGEKVAVPVEETDIICDKCGAKMIVKKGRFGKFAACPNYPQCRNTKPLEEKAAPKIIEVAPFKCEECGSDMVLRSGRFGGFYACSRYPECKFTKQKNVTLGIACPDCGGEILVKRGKSRVTFYACENYPKCQFSSWDKPSKEKCPNCGKMLFQKKGKGLLGCKTKGCGFTMPCPTDTNEV